MGVTSRTLDLAAQAKAHTTATVDAYTYSLIRAWATAWDDIAAEFDRELARLQKLGRFADAMDTERIRQLQTSMSRVVDRRLAELINETGAQVGATNRQLANQTVADMAAVMESQVDPSYWPGFIRPVPDATLTWVADRATQQITVRSYFLQQDATRAMKRELMIGLAASDNPNDAARRMLARVEGEFNGGLVRATVIARTEMLDATRDAALEQRKANADILDGWIWHADLSSRTCPACWAMHGTWHPVDEPGPIDHHQGRCTGLPVTKSAAELGLAGGDVPGTRPTQADAREKFEALPEHVQRDILGKERFEAWRAGNYPMSAWPQRVEHWETVNGQRIQAWRDSIHVSPVPKAPADGWKWPAPPEGRRLTPSEAEHFAARQQAVPFTYNGATLTPREVEFVERMHARGEMLEWLPVPERDSAGRLPKHNDFIWISRDNQQWELKSPVAKYASIRRAIASDAGAKHRFLVDLGSESASPGLLRALSAYNARTRGDHVREIVVLSDNGSTLTGIKLA
ncbi:MAG: phage head morphogenesis protein [Propionibacterium sp.]|nr:phage head morphogenesis protein [Propionibacterium sp.]